ncbi:MAG: Gfo/Idh/MocA family oxidoreductase [Phycisphaerae bacterium]|nr:Gfo/Idh/MocA family oxidoreductase [Phycisphaerae bacterium]NIU08909.1 Gfo/Idh/MocA family oxidoreductase [Phycisphaerae bacterium]NIU56550.1 Gfo/Idh/MocA family oxidoreductase [Phycisphaerae bacterium]NIW93003.1 Gfo/Idh/MocA family oxidoreductase [Phycisphaerae bacterium]
MKKKQISRRDFIGTAATAAAFTIVPRNVLGGPRHVPPSEKLNIAGIGIGGRGSGVISSVDSQNIVALCDVDWKHARGTFRRYPKARPYRDFRKMLDKEEKNIDAVTVATPDHVHAVATMAAIKRGKHVYCEKPLTHSVYEARKVAEAARKYKVATQMGNQGQATERPRLLYEYIHGGAIGPVREVHVWTDRPLRGLNSVYWPQGVERPKETPPVPDTLDWDLWLGPAPHRPYHPAYLPFNWRGWWDFGTGALGDIGCHALSPVFKALKLGPPKSVEAISTLVNKETYPVASAVHYEFAARGDMPPVKLTWYDGGMRPPRPDELEDDRQMGTNGALFIGDKGKMLGGRLIPESRMAEYGKPPQLLPRSPGHSEEWIRACKGGEPAGSNFVDHAGPLAEAVLLGNVALRPELREKMNRTKLLWDGPNLKITNVGEANQFLRRDYRDGWTL